MSSNFPLLGKSFRLVPASTCESSANTKTHLDERVLHAWVSAERLNTNSVDETSQTPRGQLTLTERFASALQTSHTKTAARERQALEKKRDHALIRQRYSNMQTLTELGLISAQDAQTQTMEWEGACQLFINHWVSKAAEDLTEVGNEIAVESQDEKKGASKVSKLVARFEASKASKAKSPAKDPDIKSYTINAKAIDTAEYAIFTHFIFRTISIFQNKADEFLIKHPEKKADFKAALKGLKFSIINKLVDDACYEKFIYTPNERRRQVALEIERRIASMSAQTISAKQKKQLEAQVEQEVTVAPWNKIRKLEHAVAFWGDVLKSSLADLTMILVQRHGFFPILPVAQTTEEKEAARELEQQYNAKINSMIDEAAFIHNARFLEPVATPEQEYLSTPLVENMVTDILTEFFTYPVGTVAQKKF